MKSNKIWQLIHRVYDIMEAGLWAFLLAAVIFIAVFVIPNIPENKAQWERVQAIEIAAENAVYCEKLHIQTGTRAHSECLLILGDLRHKIEQRIYNDSAI
jgi:hypothetical protein